jgi:hypothetical protein
MLYILLFLTSIFVSCSPYPDLSQLRDSETLSQSDDGGLLRLEPRSFETAGEAGVLVNWNLDPVELAQGLLLFRVNSSQRTFVKEITVARGMWMDSSLQDGTEYVYELLASDGSLRARAQTRTGRDWVVEGEERLPQNYAEIERLFFAPNAVLVTEGLPLDWKLSEIRGAPGARWVSFLKDRPATPGYSARSSGSGRVEVKRASGDLRLEWRGETGPRGVDGATPVGRGQRGQNGSSGRSGIDRCSNGSRGSPGGRGLAGSAGSKGESGGDVEALEFVLLYPDNNLNLQIITEPGLGGPGGRGGAGGLGGEGGRGGKAGGPDCSDGAAGPDGPLGETGATGERGNDGHLKGQVCVRRGNGGGCSAARGVLESRS